MNYKIISNFIFLFFLIFVISFTTSAMAHEVKKGKKHKPLICIPQDQLTKEQLRNQKFWNHWHRLTKNQQQCALLEITRLEGEIVLDVECGNISFRHVSSGNTFLRNDSNKNAEKIKKIKKGDEIVFVSEAAGNKNWAFVTVRIDNKKCAQGFMLAKFLLKKETDGPIDTKGELIDIQEPSWKKKGKLILVDAEGNHTLKGVVGDGKIDKIVVNDEEEVILDDNSFKAQIFVPNNGIEVRIIGYKNNQIKKKLIFTVKVGN